MLLLKDVQHVKRESGIYSLLKNGEIVYIGRSRNVYCRVLEHIIDCKKDFDHVIAVYHTDDIQMDIMEVILIDYISPKYNILKIDRETYLRVLPYDYKKHIKDNLSVVVKNLTDILNGNVSVEQKDEFIL